MGSVDWQMIEELRGEIAALKQEFEAVRRATRDRNLTLTMMEQRLAELENRAAGGGAQKNVEIQLEGGVAPTRADVDQLLDALNRRMDTIALPLDEDRRGVVHVAPQFWNNGAQRQEVLDGLQATVLNTQWDYVQGAYELTVCSPRLPPCEGPDVPQYLIEVTLQRTDGGDVKTFVFLGAADERY